MKAFVAALRRAFPHTIPVLLGYLFLGSAYGILMAANGHGLLLTLMMSVLVYAGSMQFAAVSFFSGSLSLPEIALMTLMINARHIFYGLSALEKYKDTGAKKPYLIFSLTDETYSLVCSLEAPVGTDRKLFYFALSLLNHSYWVAGSVLGVLVGSAGLFDARGIDFAMSALFLVILLEQLRVKANRLPALVGLVGSLACLLIFGADGFILPAMAVILVSLLLLRKLRRGEDKTHA